MDEMINETELEIKEIESELIDLEEQKEIILNRKKELTDRKRKIISALKKLRDARNVLENKTESETETTNLSVEHNDEKKSFSDFEVDNNEYTYANKGGNKFLTEEEVEELDPKQHV
ncbi:hypothetical protein R2F61_07505 [Mollicutes bacterium LVI A0078]|nr:hypothetical protein RZE84_07280 [Mollicutes bacterium LVI A0075]WOO90570.1 hypothetical protein R2F61_07505 [Mollicutes bacterium LVI A0078]